MKKYALKIFSLLLVIATLSLMVSCDLGSILEDIAPDDLGNGVQNGTTNDVKFTFDTTKEATEKDTTIIGEPSFIISVPTPSIDFEGGEICILYSTSNLREWYRDMPADEIDEAVAMRNNKVEETLNVDMLFEGIPYDNGNYASYTSNFYSMVATDINAAMHQYDVSANLAYPSASLAIRDYTANLLDEEMFPYFNFSLPCWNQSIANDTAINGKLHYVAGDANLSLFDNAIVIWYNKNVYDRQKEPTDPEDIQRLALDGLWTYDELYRLLARSYQDIDGTGGYSEQDFYGLHVANTPNNMNSSSATAFKYAWNIEFITENYDGTHGFDIVDNVRTKEALEKCTSLLISKGTCSSPQAAEYFASGLSIFYMDELYADENSNNKLREMEYKYGLLPLPKYDLDQVQYYTTASNSFSLMFVLDHTLSEGIIKGEAISATLELLTEESYSSVRGYYFNRVVKPKYFSTDDTEGTVTKSIALFDIIVANIKFDLCNIYGAQLNNIDNIWSQSAMTNKDTLISDFEAQKMIFEQALEELDTWFGLKDVG